MCVVLVLLGAKSPHSIRSVQSEDNAIPAKQGSRRARVFQYDRAWNMEK